MKPMLLHKSSDVPTDERFIHQLKFDGHRAIYHYDEGKVKIFTRHQNECTIQYPDMQGLRLTVSNCILDGEMIVFD
jgi:DNA ligase 1